MSGAWNHCSVPKPNENWFSHLQRDLISRGIFTSVKDLGKKLMRYIREHNKDPKPIKWMYDDPSRLIRPVPIQSRSGLVVSPLFGAGEIGTLTWW